MTFTIAGPVYSTGEIQGMVGVDLQIKDSFEDITSLKRVNSESDFSMILLLPSAASRAKTSPFTSH